MITLLYIFNIYIVYSKRLSQNVPKWQNKIAENVTKCKEVSQIVTKCHKMSQNVTKCHKVAQSVTKCHKFQSEHDYLLSYGTF